ncbi:hypothetical protein N303_09163, partial [Cuculus canorus]
KIPGSFSQVAVRNRFATWFCATPVSMRFPQPDPSQQFAFLPIAALFALSPPAFLDTTRMSNKYKPSGTCKKKKNVHF